MDGRVEVKDSSNREGGWQVRITTKCLFGLSIDCNGVLAIKAYCGTNYAFGEHLTTAFTGAARIIDARLASEISPKITFFLQRKQIHVKCFDIETIVRNIQFWWASHMAHMPDDTGEKQLLFSELTTVTRTVGRPLHVGCQSVRSPCLAK